MNILVVNAGSSSMKYQLINMDDETVMAKGNAERIGIEGSKLVHRATGKDPVEVVQPMSNHTEAIRLIMKELTDPEHGAISDMSQIHAVGHRIVHGGDKMTKSVIVDDYVKSEIEKAIAWAPLHNGGALMGIEACENVMPGVPMVTVFDTAFHQTIPDYAHVYGIPYKYYAENRIRRYGAHGTSHRYVSQRCAQFLGLPLENSRIISCHVGNGGSITAVKNGQSVDTSMGLTPLEGILMGSRSGDVDPTVVEFIMRDGKTIQEAMDVLNKQSGLLGVSGVSSDMRDIVSTAQQGNARSQLALNIFNYRIRKYIGAYAAAMGGVDAIVFTAGIGENVQVVREGVLQGLEWMGVKLDPERNKQRGDEFLISTDDSPVKVVVIATNEELMIARDTLALVSAQ